MFSQAQDDEGGQDEIFLLQLCGPCRAAQGFAIPAAVGITAQICQACAAAAQGVHAYRVQPVEDDKQRQSAQYPSRQIGIDQGQQGDGVW